MPGDVEREMKTTRRGFFKLIAGAAVIPVVAKADFVGRLPVIYGDGVHDDAAGLNALFRGEVVEFANAGMADSAGWSGAVFQMPIGKFRIATPIEIRARGEREIDFRGSVIDVTEPMDSAIIIRANPEDMFHIQSVHIKCNGVALRGFKVG